jgi:hypothetical protein
MGTRADGKFTISCIHNCTWFAGIFAQFAFLVRRHRNVFENKRLSYKMSLNFRSFIETGNRAQGCGLWISCRSTKFPERYRGDVKGEIREVSLVFCTQS